jgi:hypothetical protein
MPLLHQGTANTQPTHHQFNRKKHITCPKLGCKYREFQIAPFLALSPFFCALIAYGAPRHLNEMCLKLPGRTALCFGVRKHAHCISLTNFTYGTFITRNALKSLHEGKVCDVVRDERFALYFIHTYRNGRYFTVCSTVKRKERKLHFLSSHSSCGQNATITNTLHEDPYVFQSSYRSNCMEMCNIGLYSIHNTLLV